MQTNEKKSNDSEIDSSFLSVPASSSVSNSSGRNKIMLKPGRSLMDWIRFTNSKEVLFSTGGRVLEVSSRELAKHDTVHDTWIAIRGKVYNITHYLEYHPGGEDELMRGAGKDSTELFNQVHRYVNVEAMLQKCFIGFLKNSWTVEVSKFPNIKQLKIKHQKSTPIEEVNQYVNKSHQKLKEESEHINQIKSRWKILPSSDSSLNDIAIRCDLLDDTLTLQFKSSSIKQEGLIIDLVGKELFVKIQKTPALFLTFGIFAFYEECYKVMIESGSSLELFLKKLETTRQTECGTSINYTICDPTDQFIYWSCKLVNKIAVNHNTFLFTFMLPSGTKMWVPMGCHVLIRANVEGSEIIRCYTPLPSYVFPNKKFDDEQDGTKINLMIKIYQSGTLTPVINRCKLGENLYISNYSGNFKESFVVNCDSLIMLAAGTGITPMIRIVSYIVADKNIKRSLRLLFFNKTENDILWRKELEDIKSTYTEFQVYHILSEPDLKWKGYTGQLNKDLCTELLTKESTSTNQRFLICGPIHFTLNALSYLKEAGFSKNDIYTFSGSW